MTVWAAIGVELQASDMQSPPSFTTIAQLGTLTTDYKIDNVDVTNHSSPNRTKQKFPVLIDSGGIKAELFLDPLDDTHKLLKADADAFFVRDYRMLIPTDPQSSRSYQAFVANLSDSFAVNNVMKASLELMNFVAPVYN